jgi:hypothetical protein
MERRSSDESTKSGRSERSVGNEDEDLHAARKGSVFGATPGADARKPREGLRSTPSKMIFRAAAQASRERPIKFGRLGGKTHRRKSKKNHRKTKHHKRR